MHLFLYGIHKALLGHQYLYPLGLNNAGTIGSVVCTIVFVVFWVLIKWIVWIYIASIVSDDGNGEELVMGICDTDHCIPQL